MKEHNVILKLASEYALPEEINSSNRVNLDVFKELYDQGYISAIDISSDDGTAFMEPKITLLGREYLAQLQQQPQRWWQSFNKRIAVLALIVALLSLVATLGWLNA